MNTQQLVQQHINELDKLADDRGFDPVYQEVVRCLHEKLDRRNISPVEFLAGDFSIEPEPIESRAEFRDEVEESIREKTRDEIYKRADSAINDVESAVRRVRAAVE